MLFRRIVWLAFPIITACGLSAGADDVRRDEACRIEMIERVSPSVVSILSPDGATGGSGVIISPDGYGITNFHVVMPLLETRKGLGGLSDGKTWPLEVLGVDPTGDLAMFRLTGKDRFAPAPLDDSDAVSVGDEIVALGNPFMLAENFTPTATFGIVTGVQRYQFGADARSLLYTDCIQIDASINPGNSGGPLFDMRGRVIGINGRASFKNADALKRRINVGVAYAIGINQVKRFMPALKAGYLVEHGTLGATVTDTQAGVVFDRMLPSSAAAEAGIRIGDELVELDGRPVRSANDFANIIGVYPAGWTVEVAYRRDGLEYRRMLNLDPLTLPGDAPLEKADPVWIRQAATTQPSHYETLDDPTSLDDRTRRDREGALTPVDDLLPGVVRIYGGRIAGERGYATGVIVSPDGQVVTALGLLLAARDIKVVTADGSVHSARAVHRDSYRQLALLAIRGGAGTASQDGQASWPAVNLDEHIAPAIGETVFVVGNPFKIAEGEEACTVNRGIISGRVRMDARQPGGGAPRAYRGEILLMDAITSNPGSPGSAVFDARGRWVGLVGEIVESRLTNTLLNYAYPPAEIAAFLRDARADAGEQDATAGPAAPVADASNKPGYHGIRLSRIGFRRKLPFIDAVADDSPAARAGVKPGDLVLNVNGRPIARSQAFDEACERLHPGDEMVLVVKRDEKLVTLQFKLEEARP